MNLNVIETPHLPAGKVGCVLIGEGYRGKLESPLLSRGVEVVWLPQNRKVDPRLRWHADLSVFHLGGNRFVAQGSHHVKLLTDRGLDVIPAYSKQGMEYPTDTGLCGCILGEYFIHKPAYTDETVLDHLNGRRLIRVNQGYTKCAVCVVDSSSIITSDSGIAIACESHGIDVLKIRPGHIELDGFDSGFIGGSTFKLSEHELAFTGYFKDHPDKSAIVEFLAKKEIKPVFLTDDTIFDIGSAIPLLEV